MVESEFIDALDRQRNAVTRDTLALADAAVTAFPESRVLWCLRGDLIQLADAETPHRLEDALASYRRAAQIDPTNPEAPESIGFYFDVVEDEPALAEPHFRSAIALGAGRNCHLGLANVLVALGRGREARDLLTTSAYRNEPAVAALINELASMR